MKKKILLYGGMSTAFIVQEMLKENGLKVYAIFDEYIKKPHFLTYANFSNKKIHFKKFIKNSTHFFVCIGMLDAIEEIRFKDFFNF